MSQRQKLWEEMKEVVDSMEVAVGTADLTWVMLACARTLEICRELARHEIAQRVVNANAD